MAWRQGDGAFFCHLVTWPPRHFVTFHTAVTQFHYAVGISGHFFIVGDDDESDALFLVQLLQQGHHLRAGRAVQIAGWFIGQDERGVVNEGAGDSHPLLFATRKFGGDVLQPMAQPYRFQQSGGAGLPLCFGHTIEH